MKIIISLLVICLWALQADAQQEAAVWYFGGYAGMDFNAGSPELLTNSVMYASSGCSAISDKAGNLLFYTNGNTVWNHNHQKMPNGSGLNGSQILNQNSLIAPLPGSENIFYLFTVNATFDSVGLNYSIVDLNLDDEMGDVTKKNELLVKGLLEKITGSKHCNDEDIWIVGHNRLDGYYSFLLTSDSLTKQPVVSNTGTIAKGDIGYLKISPASNRIAMPVNNENILVELSRFDNRSGEVFDPLMIYAIDNTVYAYGIEFSPNGNYLYISTGGKAYKTWQYDITLSTEEEVNNSAMMIAEGNHFAMQLALDGKMYIAKENRDYLSVISNPKQTGIECDYMEFGIDLDGRNSLMGLPNFLPFYFYDPELSIDGGCLGDTTVLQFAQHFNSDSISWDFGDGSNKVSTTMTGTVKHLYQQAGKYIVRAMVHHCGLTDTVSATFSMVEKPVADLGSDTLICSSCTIELDGGEGMDYWIWQDGNEGRFYEVNENGVYAVKVWKDGCTAQDSITIQKASTQVLLPTAFTPNDDGLNDDFKPVSNEVLTDYRMVVFNRRGNLLFESYEPESGWDGSCPSGPCQPGVYNWKITYVVQQNNGFVTMDKKGTVVLLK